MISQMSLVGILLVPMLGALISYFIGRKSEKHRDYFNMMMTGIEFLVVSMLYSVLSMGTIEVFVPDIMGVGLYLKLDMFRYVFVWVTSLIWFLSTIYSTQYLIKYKKRNRYYAFFMLTLSSTIGIFISENLLNLFTFFEIMSFTSYALVIHDEDRYAHEAGKSYLSMAIGGGLVLLLGLFMLFDYTETLNISQLPERVRELGSVKYVISILIIIGFGVKASIFPLHVWLPKAHPAAPTPASAILSGILIKTGLFGIFITLVIIMEKDMYLSLLILVLGFINMFLGGFLALFQRNIKRILAYSSMSQAGYILVGIGLIGLLKEHQAIALYATLYHIVNHALFKVLLFLGAGIIYMILHDLSINVVRGFGKHKKKLKIVFFIGLLGIIGMPGFNGYISKTLLHEALAEAHHLYDSRWFLLAEIIFTLSSSMTVAYLLKIFMAVFMEENDGYRGEYQEFVNKRALLPLAILSGMVIFIGLKPQVIFRRLQGAVAIFSGHVGFTPHFYTRESIATSLMTILLGGCIYALFVKKYLRVCIENKKTYINPTTKWFNLSDHLYQPVLICMYKMSSLIFHMIDQGAMNVLRYTSSALRWIRQIDLNYDPPLKAIENRIAFKIEDTTKAKKVLNRFSWRWSIETPQIFTDLIKVGASLTSIMNGLFVFAIMLMITMLVLLV